MTYECSICQYINHASRLHCSVCGIIPAIYSITGKAIDCTVESLGPTEVTAAIGCIRTGQYPPSRVKLQTVPLDYYGE